jgi:hypothetical protein
MELSPSKLVYQVLRRKQQRRKGGKEERRERSKQPMKNEFGGPDNVTGKYQCEYGDIPRKQPQSVDKKRTRLELDLGG